MSTQINPSVLAPPPVGRVTDYKSRDAPRSRPGWGGLCSDVTVPRRGRGAGLEVPERPGADAGWLSAPEPGRSEPGGDRSLRISYSARRVVAGRWTRAQDLAGGQQQGGPANRLLSFPVAELSGCPEQARDDLLRSCGRLREAA